MSQWTYKIMWNFSNTAVTSFGDAMSTIGVVAVISGHIFKNKSKARFLPEFETSVSVTRSVERKFWEIEM